MSALRAEVFQYFVQKYDANDGINFWSTSFDEEIPMEVLKQKTLNKLKRIKIEQILLKNNGIASDISYAGFLKTFTGENERRRRALKENEPIFI